MKMARLLTLCSLALASKFLSGTAVYVTLEKGDLYIGEDTLMVVPQLGLRSNHCKMFVNDKYALTLLGAFAIFEANDAKDGKPVGQTEYSFDLIANNLLAKPHTPDEMKAGVAEGIIKWQKAALRATPPDMRPSRVGDNFAVSASIFWFDGSKPMMQSVRIVPVLVGGEIDTTEGPDELIEIPADRIVAAPESQQKAFRDLDTSLTLTRITDPVAQLDVLLKAESRLSKDLVGPPFTIFRLSKMGARWMPGAGAKTCSANSHLTISH
jgi:hypothetical protein